MIVNVETENVRRKVTEAVPGANRLMVPTYKAALIHAEDLIRFGKADQVEIVYSWHRTDEVGSRLIHVVHAANRDIYNGVIKDGGREILPLATVRA